MRVGVVIQGLHPRDGGADTFQQSILDSIIKYSGHHTIFILDRSSSSPTGMMGNLSVIGIKRNLWERFLAKVSKIARFLPSRVLSRKFLDWLDEIKISKVIKAKKIDLIWYLSPNAEITDAPYFITLWDLEHRTQPWFPEVLYEGWSWEMREEHYRKVLPRAARIIVGTEVGKSQAIGFYGIDSQNIVVNPFPVPKMNLSQGYLDDLNSMTADSKIVDPYFIYPAQFWPHKNHINLLLALKSIRDRGMRCPKLVFTGGDKGNLKFVKKITAKLELDNLVIFRGFVNRLELYQLIHHAIGMIFVTYFGPDNIPPLEAFSSGCPVIASVVGGSKDQLGDAVIAVNPSEPKEIADAMLQLMDSPALRLSLIERGFQIAETRTIETYLSVIIHEIDSFEKIMRNWRE